MSTQNRLHHYSALSSISGLIERFDSLHCNHDIVAVLVLSNPPFFFAGGGGGLVLSCLFVCLFLKLFYFHFNTTKQRKQLNDRTEIKITSKNLKEQTKEQ